MTSIAQTTHDAPIDGQLVGRYFTDPSDDERWYLGGSDLTWKTVDAVLRDLVGERMREWTLSDIRVPEHFTDNQTNIAAKHYLRVIDGKQESGWDDTIRRVVGTITEAGVSLGYFSEDGREMKVFRSELAYLLAHSMVCFNSPVLYNIGVPGRRQQPSACFILSVEDTFDSIQNWWNTEGVIFRGGSGAGVNISQLRAAGEPLSTGGTSSGPVVFMRGADAQAGVIKSGGQTRRAAKMVIMNADHPDIEDFIWCKAKEEAKARSLEQIGYDMNLQGYDHDLMFYQNANNSVRVTDEFMKAVANDDDWELRYIVSNEVAKTVKARDLFRQIAEAAFQCGCPGLQFDTTINRWHTVPNAGRINGSNPCLTGDTLVAVADGRGAIPISDLVDTEVPVYCRDSNGATTIRTMRNIRLTRENSPLVEVRLDDGTSVRCTKDHPFMLLSGEFVEAGQLKPGQSLARFDSKSEIGSEPETELAIPVNHKVASICEAGSADVYDGEVDELHNFAVVTTGGDNGTGALSGIFVHNCSEYMSLDNSSCNLASLNLLAFLNDDGSFQTDAFLAAIRVMITAMDILISLGEYPTPEIADTTKAFRQLGLGYANLGAMLMRLGIPYDSNDGRSLAAAVTSVMSGAAYLQSARLAALLEPFSGFANNRERMLDVLCMHKDASRVAQEQNCVYARQTKNVAVVQEADRLYAEAELIWNDAIELAGECGVRNSQISLLAPTGTIGLVMGCDTTGIEPDTGLVKTKTLHGGGTMKLVNTSVIPALKRLGYSEEQIKELTAIIEQEGGITSSTPGLIDPDHAAVFATSLWEPNSISWQGHIRMMGAVQPFLSGAISKTVNLPSCATPKDVEEAYLLAHSEGVKAIAVYVDGSKVTQPIAVGKAKQKEAETKTEALPPAQRLHLPQRRSGGAMKVHIGDVKVYLHAGEYPDGTLGEIFLDLSKEGSTLQAFASMFSVAFSLALQWSHGKALEDLIKTLKDTKFDPHGVTDDPDIRITTSIVDWIVRRLAIDYLPKDVRQAMNIYTSEERKELAMRYGDAAPIRTSPDTSTNNTRSNSGNANAIATGLASATARVKRDLTKMCNGCGSVNLRRAGACFVCEDCGGTTGCS